MNFAIGATVHQAAGIFDALAPLVALIALGAGLARVRLLGPGFIADLNKLAFYVALPALIFYSSARVSAPVGRALAVFGVLLAATVAVGLAAYVVAAWMRLARGAWGTFVQAAFRGNLALVGLPVLSFSLGKEALPLAAVVMTAMMIVYNFLAVLVLSGGMGCGQGRGEAVARFGRSLISNPLVLAGVAGLAWGGWRIPLPLAAERVFSSLGQAAVPIALLCVGGGMAMRPFAGGRAALAAAMLKVAALPLLVWILGQVAGLASHELRTALVFAAGPTAAASYVMAVQMGGDEALASQAITFSTLLSAPALAAALWLTS